MPESFPHSEKTRASLLKRLRDLQDEASWREFFDTYWGLIYGVARRAGLTDSEAQDATQETFLAMAGKLPGFDYDPTRGSFKARLLRMARWRIADQFRKRPPAASPPRDGETQTSAVGRLVDPNTPDLDALWETDWRQTLLDAALARVKRRVDLEKFQVFDLYANKGWPAKKVAEAFGLRVNQVYVARTRIVKMIRREVDRLKAETEN